jgi:hypothetical protein
MPAAIGRRAATLHSAHNGIRSRAEPHQDPARMASTHAFAALRRRKSGGLQQSADWHALCSVQSKARKQWSSRLRLEGNVSEVSPRPDNERGSTAGGFRPFLSGVAGDAKTASDPTTTATLPFGLPRVAVT